MTDRSATAPAETRDAVPHGRAFPLWPFFLVLIAVALGAAGLNYLIDPLWYAGGNRLTHRNFVFNERIAKTNLFERSGAARTDDCLILGSSRAIALRPSRLAPQRCFSFAMKAGEVPEFIAYAKFAKERGMAPKTVYFTVDEFNFVRRTETAWRASPKVTPSPGAFHAFFSLDVLTFSAMTLLGISPDRDNYYDTRFELQEFPGHAVYEPRVIASPRQTCELSRTARYDELMDVFPDARWVGYVPLKAAWVTVGDTYAAGVLDCELEGIHRVAQRAAALYDFTIPSPVTTDAALTYDGSHFSPDANDRLAEGLLGRRPELSLPVKEMTLDEYRAAYRKRLHEFLASQRLLEWWKD